MQSQQSFDQVSHKGRLYVVSTPIGNLDDMTFRAIRVLKSVDVIACEDTRVTKKLTGHFQIDTPLASYHEHNKEKSGKRFIRKLEEGKSIALVSDAGTPIISDPGSELVAACIAKNIAVIPVPGANAAVTALIASGLATNHFYFYGFLPRQKKTKNDALARLQTVDVPIIFYEAPHRLHDTLQTLFRVWGDRKAVIARELTKRYEQFVRGTIAELCAWSMDNQVLGECCIIVEGGSAREEDEWWQSMSLFEHVTHYIAQEGMTARMAIKQVAKDRDLPKRDVYHAYHIAPEKKRT